ncbi:MAG: hypothetical protein KDA60_00055 [Planctomycetales bacterium]|nr:hypothetical protein [Planctomycetales bacterium]
MSDLSPEDWKQLRANDAATWRRLLFDLLPLAIEALRQGFGLPASDDANNTEAALISAWSSFQRHFLNERRFEDARDLETLTAHFVRITYNRSQRRKRRAAKLLNAPAFDVSDPTLRPDDAVAHSDFLAYFRVILDEEVRALSSNPTRFKVVRNWLASEMRSSQAELAREAGIHQATVSRYLDDFKERISRRLLEDGE